MSIPSFWQFFGVKMLEASRIDPWKAFVRDQFLPEAGAVPRNGVALKPSDAFGPLLLPSDCQDLNVMVT